MKTKSLISTVIFSTMLFYLAGCSEDFEKFTDVTKLRVLAISVEPAELSPGDTGNIQALVAASADKEVRYKWSWCPVMTTSLNGHQCPVTEALLQNVIAENTGVPAAMIPKLGLFDLGTDTTAIFPYVVSEDILRAVCQQVVAQMGDTLPLTPDCDGRLYSSIRLDVTDGEESVQAVKQMNLLLNSELIPNGNPTIEELQLIRGSQSLPVVDNGAAVFWAGEKAVLRATIPLSASEAFETVDIETGKPIFENESLFATWFITGGETEFGRTSYIPTQTPFENLRTNTWWPPSLDETNGTATIHVVLQDERGGVSWISRTVNLKERP